MSCGTPAKVGQDPAVHHRAVSCDPYQYPVYSRKVKSIATPMLLTPGTSLSRYEILAPINAGGTSGVREARDTWRTRVRQDRDGIRAGVKERRLCIALWLTTARRFPAFVQKRARPSQVGR